MSEPNVHLDRIENEMDLLHEHQHCEKPNTWQALIGLIHAFNDLKKQFEQELDQ